MATFQHRVNSQRVSVARLLAFGILLVSLFGSAAIGSPVAAIGNDAGPGGRAVEAQATIASQSEPGSRLLPVGNGDTIDSPAEVTDDTNSSSTSWWWRVVFGAGVVVVVLVALVQRRHVPERAGRSTGNTPRGRSDRNALGH